MNDLNFEELLTIARMRKKRAGEEVKICGVRFRMCVRDDGSEFMHNIDSLVTDQAA